MTGGRDVSDTIKTRGPGRWAGGEVTVAAGPEVDGVRYLRLEVHDMDGHAAAMIHPQVVFQLMALIASWVPKDQIFASPTPRCRCLAQGQRDPECPLHGKNYARPCAGGLCTDAGPCQFHEAFPNRAGEPAST
jgi:hypothetical protein